LGGGSRGGLVTASAGYLERLAQRLAEGLKGMPAERRTRHAKYLADAQNGDGGFSGREGGSDLYYAGFALRGLVCLDALEAKTARRAASFLRDGLTREASIVDLVSLLYGAWVVALSAGEDLFAEHPGDWRERLAVALESYRSGDGGYAKAAGANAGSTYHTFLVALAYDMIGLEVPNPSPLIDFVVSRRREDGGFVEVAPMRRSGTNPTAAAVALLLKFDACDATTRAEVIPFLSQMQTAEGGLRANTRIPLADLLSTFTGLLTLIDLEAAEEIDVEAAGRYAEALEQPTGGFRGGLWDENSDVEYTFYGLGTLALVNLLSVKKE